MRRVIPLASGALFGAGACLSGMVRPSKVLGFLDFGGAWDASLLVVMACALAIHVLAWRLVPAQRHPGPPSTVVDARLLGGAALFGIGWGLAGYCPGPALVSIVSGARGSLVFVAAMIAGMWLAGHAPSGKPDTGEG
ncbi:MAG TPA: DUF6691 family protein [Kofleriaceae bacterium]|nr:DUF6691 family protein [Kofleriaceae bacterium]